MPRVGGVYSAPAGTKATSGQTIQSVPYNNFIDDLVTDANNARPVTSGGTGSGTASGAKTNLGFVDLATAETLANKTLVDATTFFADEADPTKKLQFQINNFGTGATRTWQFPDINGVVLGVNNTAVVTNKSLVDATTSFVDDGDTSKVLKFEVSGIATATTRTVAWPDFSGTVVVSGGPQTVAGIKTFTARTVISVNAAAVISDYLQLIPTDAGSGKPRLNIGKSSITPDRWDITVTEGGSPTGNLNLEASTVTAPTPAGTDNSTKVATTAFVQGLVGPGSFVKILAQTISGSPSSLAFTGIPTSGYSKFILICEDVVTNEFAQSDYLGVQVSTDNGSTYRTTSGDYYSTAATAQSFVAAAGVCGTTSTFKHGYAEIDLYGLGNSSRSTTAKVMANNYWVSATSNNDGAPINSARVVAESDNAIRLVSTHGSSLQSGTVTLYGVKA